MTDEELIKDIKKQLNTKTAEYNTVRGEAERLEEVIKNLNTRLANLTGGPVYDVNDIPLEFDITSEVSTVELARFRDRQGGW